MALITRTNYHATFKQETSRAIVHGGQVVKRHKARPIDAQDARPIDRGDCLIVFRCIDINGVGCIGRRFITTVAMLARRGG